MNKIRVILVFVFITSIFSCDNDSGGDDELSCFKRDLHDRTTYQLKRKWEFLGFFQQTTNTERCKPESVDEMNIEFNSRNRFHAISSCNTYEGYYSINKDNSLKVDSVMGTLKLCINDTIMKWEESYLIGLKNATNFRITRNILVIETNNRNNMVFRAD